MDEKGSYLSGEQVAEGPLLTDSRQSPHDVWTHKDCRIPDILIGAGISTLLSCDEIGCFAPLRPFINPRQSRSQVEIHRTQRTHAASLGPGAAPCVCVRQMHRSSLPFLDRKHLPRLDGVVFLVRKINPSTQALRLSIVLISSSFPIPCSDQVRRINRLAKLICDQLKLRSVQD